MTVRNLFDEFKLWCPNYPFGYDAKMESHYRNKVEQVKALNRIKLNNPITPPDAEKVIQYNEWRGSRAPSGFADLPEKIQGIIGKILENHLEITDMWVCGSYASGSWIDENTEDSYKELKREVKGKSKISDLDLIIKPEVFLGEYEMKIDICHFPQNNVIKVK